jgi:flagellar export protein FliJ
MAKFAFRLQKVLEYRQMLEEEAKQRYLDARVARLDFEQELEANSVAKEKSIHSPTATLVQRNALVAYVERLEVESAQMKIALSVLLDEEAAALNSWQDRKRDVEALIKLRHQAYDAWRLEESRREQAELDEWAVMRR